MRSSGGTGKRSGGRNVSIGSQNGGNQQSTSKRESGGKTASAGPPPGFESGVQQQQQQQGSQQKRRASNSTSTNNVWSSGIGTWNNSMSTAPIPSGKSSARNGPGGRGSYGGAVKDGGAGGQNTPTSVPCLNGHSNSNNSNNNIGSYSSAALINSNMRHTSKGNKANTPQKTDTCQTPLQGKSSLELHGLDRKWASTARNQFLGDEMRIVVEAMVNKQKYFHSTETNRLVGTYEYLEKDDTECSKLHYMKGFQPIDIEEYKIRSIRKYQAAGDSRLAKSPLK